MFEIVEFSAVVGILGNYNLIFVKICASNLVLSLLQHLHQLLVSFKSGLHCQIAVLDQILISLPL